MNEIRAELNKVLRTKSVSLSPPEFDVLAVGCRSCSSTALTESLRFNSFPQSQIHKDWIETVAQLSGRKFWNHFYFNDKSWKNDQAPGVVAKCYRKDGMAQQEVWQRGPRVLSPCWRPRSRRSPWAGAPRGRCSGRGPAPPWHCGVKTCKASSLRPRWDRGSACTGPVAGENNKDIYSGILGVPGRHTPFSNPSSHLIAVWPRTRGPKAFHLQNWGQWLLHFVVVKIHSFNQYPLRAAMKITSDKEVNPSTWWH